MLRSLSAPTATPAEPAAEPARAGPPAPTAPSNVVPLRPRTKRRLWVPLAAAASVLAPIGYHVATTAFVEPLALVGDATDAQALNTEAESVRSEAADALEAHQWARCLALLDQAKNLDPEGDLAQAARDVRRIAMSKLGIGDASKH